MRLHLLDQAVHAGQRGGAHEELGLGVVRHHVRDIATVGDDAVDAGVARDVLAQRVDAVEGLDHGVEGVDAVEGIGGRVGGLAVEGGPHEDAGEGVAAPLDRRADRLARPGVGAHGRRYTVEDPGVGHDHLAADRLFRRRAEDRHLSLAAEVGQRRGEPDAGADAGDGDQVVAAAVADAGQRVVLGEIGDLWLTRTDGRLERGREVSHAARQREAVLLQEVGAGGAALDFLQRDLGVGVDEPGEFDQAVLCGRNRRCCRLLRCGQVNLLSHCHLDTPFITHVKQNRGILQGCAALRAEDIARAHARVADRAALVRRHPDGRGHWPLRTRGTVGIAS